MSYGRLDMSGNLPEVEFERVLEASADVVWAVLSTEDGLPRWMAPARVDLRLGGRVEIDFGEGGLVGGEILDLNPGAILEYRWSFVGEPDSIVRFELEAVDSTSTKLRLHHRLLPFDQAIGYGAGWHAYLDRLEAVSAGRNPVDWDERFSEVIPDYKSQTD